MPLISIKVDNCKTAETALIAEFDEQFTQMSEYGREYYNGDMNQMQIAFHRFAMSLLEDVVDDVEAEEIEIEEDIEDIDEEIETSEDENSGFNLADVELAEVTVETKTTVVTTKSFKKRDLRCEKCGKQYKTKGGYEKHIESSDCDKKYPCPMCGSEFNDMAHLERHAKRKTPCVSETPLVIDNSTICTCGKKFTTRWNLKRHQETCGEKIEGKIMYDMIKNLKKEIQNLKK
jgi:predicted transcriptional regulator